MTINELKNIFSTYFEREVSKKFVEMSKKDSSIGSRKPATVIIDDSVFKHWFANEPLLKDFEVIYGTFLVVNLVVRFMESKCLLWDFCWHYFLSFIF